MKSRTMSETKYGILLGIGKKFKLWEAAYSVKYTHRAVVCQRPMILECPEESNIATSTTSQILYCMLWVDLQAHLAMLTDLDRTCRNQGLLP